MTPGSLRRNARCQLPRNQFREIRGKLPLQELGRGVLFLMEHRTVRIGLLGLGHVGGAIAEALRHHRSLLVRRTGVLPLLTRIAVRHREKPRPIAVDRTLLTDDAWEVVRDPSIEVVIEAIGGVTPAGEYVEEALCRGKSVVTANKQLVSARSWELEELAADAGCIFAYEASVGGALPVVRLLRDGLAGDRIRSIVGILNGTANYILTRMEKGIPFGTALASAQALGLAEPDPADDLDGRDAAAKLAILASLAFDTHIRADQISSEGIRQISPADVKRAREADQAIRLVAAARRRDGHIEAGVFPAPLPRVHSLARLENEWNGVLLQTDLAGEVFLSGRGAGGVPTSSAILADLVMVLAATARATRRGRALEVVPLPHKVRTASMLLGAEVEV